MTNTICLLVIVTVSIVYIYDVAQFPRNFISTILTRIFKRDIYEVKLPKLLECSLCITTWFTLGLLLFTAPQYWYLSLLCGWSTKYVLYVFTICDEFLSLLFKSIESLLTKLNKIIL